MRYCVVAKMRITNARWGAKDVERVTRMIEAIHPSMRVPGEDIAGAARMVEP